ncbi:MAG: hypothetical protein IH840_07630 [Candidatus Heimdallarchaeota archaeon]|nr:hypothetical protein [Candidatus Heimdallarchaeota archaeon]
MTMKSKFVTGIGVTIIILLTLSVSASIHRGPLRVIRASDITYEFGTTGNVLVWQYEADETQDLPSTYTVKIDNVNLESHIAVSWEDNVNITVNVDGLALGEHVVTISVNDTGTDAGLAPISMDIAFVTVVEVGGLPTSEDTTTDDTTTDITTGDTTSEDTSSDAATDDETPLNWNSVLIGAMGVMLYKRRIK